jgi:hypothetical protein
MKLSFRLLSCLKVTRKVSNACSSQFSLKPISLDCAIGRSVPKMGPTLQVFSGTRQLPILYALRVAIPDGRAMDCRHQGDFEWKNQQQLQNPRWRIWRDSCQNLRLFIKFLLLCCEFSVSKYRMLIIDVSSSAGDPVWRACGPSQDVLEHYSIGRPAQPRPIKDLRYPGLDQSEDSVTIPSIERPKHRLKRPNYCAAFFRDLVTSRSCLSSGSLSGFRGFSCLTICPFPRLRWKLLADRGADTPHLRILHSKQKTQHHLHYWNFLGAKSPSIRDCVGRSVGPSIPHDARLRGKIIVTSRLIREEEEEEETDYIAIPLRRVLRT